jgi:hypothetical protein
VSQNDDAESPPPAAPAPAPRKWEPPRIQSGQLFEANSLACFKSGPTPEECYQNPPFKS